MEIENIYTELKKQIREKVEPSLGEWSYHEIEIEVHNNIGVFWFNLSFNVDDDGRFKNVDIYEHGIQFSDFEGKLNDKYISYIVKMLEQDRVLWERLRI